MARYKVSITVFKDPNGKTMKGLSFFNFLGDLCQGFALICVLGGIAALTEGNLGPVQIAVLAVLVAAGVLGGVLIHKSARAKAQQRYLEVLSEMEAPQAQGQQGTEE